MQESSLPAQEKLNLFIEKAHRLDATKFVKAVREGQKPLGLSGTRTGPDSFVIARSGPDQDEIDALAITLRMYVQDGDGISFREISEVFETLPVDEELKRKVKEQRRTLNSWLDQPGMLKEIRGEQVSRRMLFDTFLYGAISHANPKKRAKLAEWCSSPQATAVVEHEFTAITAQLVNAVFWFAQACQLALAQAADARKDETA